MRSFLYPLACSVLFAALVYGGDAKAQTVTSEDFDLATVVGLMSSTGRGAASDMSALEQLINDTMNGINNVDLDSDGWVDYVGCMEIRNRSSRTVAFMAYPSSSRGRLSVQIASVTIRHDSYGRLIHLRAMHAGRDGVAREASVRYSHGYAHHLFLNWFLGTRSTYRQTRNPYGFYRPHARLPAAEAQRRRAAFYRRLRQPPVAPIPPELM